MVRCLGCQWLDCIKKGEGQNLSGLARSTYSPMDKDIRAFLGLGSTFMASTMARMGLKVLLDISEALTAQWGLRPFPLGKEGLFPLRLTWTSRTEDTPVLLFTWIRQESISGRESLQGTQNKSNANPKAVPVPAIDYRNPQGD